MLFFTSDLHFYHEKIIRHTNRPFHNADEMNTALIKNWNQKVSPDDEVYILGDFTMKGADIATACLSSLKGKKHLIKGNHDNFADSPHFEKSLFASIRDYAEITYLNTRFILFHYPILEWNNCRKGSIALHGHQHNHQEYNLKNRQNRILRYDVGVDANAMQPVSAQEIIDFFHFNLPFSVSSITEILEPVFKRFSVQRAVLFGSYAKGCATAQSDVDIIVDTDLKGLDFVSLYCDVQDALGGIDLDLFARYELISGGCADLDIAQTGIEIYRDDCRVNETDYGLNTK